MLEAMFYCQLVINWLSHERNRQKPKQSAGEKESHYIFYTKSQTTALEQSNRPLYGYGGEQLVVRGKCSMKCQYKDSRLTLKFRVVDTPAPSVLWLQECLDFGLIKLILSVSGAPEVSIMDEFADVFKGIGLFPGECTIHIDPNAVPVVHPPCRVPLALRDCLEEELQNMEKQQIIAKVTEPTTWVNSTESNRKNAYRQAESVSRSQGPEQGYQTTTLPATYSWRHHIQTSRSLLLQRHGCQIRLPGHKAHRGVS